MDAVETEAGEGLVEPLRGKFRLVNGLALHAAARVAGGVDRVDGAFGAERGGVRVPHRGAAAGAVQQDDRGAGRARLAGGAVAVDVRGAEAGLHVRLGHRLRAHGVQGVACGEVAVAPLVVHVPPDIGTATLAVSGRGLGHGWPPPEAITCS